MRKTKLSVIVNNCSDEVVNDYRYILASVVNGELWYYGASNTLERSIEIVKDLGAHGQYILIIDTEV